jgi:SulP family sulfate permease
LRAVADHVTKVQPAALLAALVTMAVALLARPLNRWVPAMLLAVLAGALFAKLLAWALPQWPALTTVQALPGALPPLSWPDLSVDTVRSLFGATLVMTLLALTEATAIAKAVARQYNDVLDGNREFIGQGLANLAGAFSSSMPCSGSFNRSGVNVEAGARTPLAAASAAVFLVFILAAVAPLAKHLPLAVVAGLLFIVAWGLIDAAEMRRLWQEEPLERVPLVVTLLGTLALSLEWAILLGITSALLVRRAAR